VEPKQHQSESSPDPALSKLDSAEDLAVQRFGSDEGLAIVSKNTLELSSFYAQRYELDADDPEVMLVSTALAFARHKEFMLIKEIEHDLYSRVITNDQGLTYGQILFNTTRTGAYREVHREIDRLHSRAHGYLRELRELAREAKQRPR